MTRASRTFLSYLRAYLDESPKRRGQLRAVYKKKTGKDLNSGNLARHLQLRNEPGLDVAMVYISFLHQAGELLPGKKGQPVFFYARPQILKP